MLETRDRDRWRRETRAMVLTAARQDPEGFAEIAALADELRADLWRAGIDGLKAAGYSYRDIARAAKVPVTTVRRRHISAGK